MTNLERIIEVAKHQDGYAATYQVDVSRQMFSHLESDGSLERIQPGIYRVTYFPVSDDEQFIVAYLWSRERAVLSHATALWTYDLSDVLPNSVHVTYPSDAALPQYAPPWMTLHRGEVAPGDRQWHGVVPVTKVDRTLIDLAVDGFDFDFFEQALRQAKARALVPADFELTILRALMTSRAT